MSSFYALSAKDNAFIVRAGTVEELAQALDRILLEYSEFAARHFKKGVFVIEAESIKEAKQISRGNHEAKPIYPELPLLRTAITNRIK